VPLQHSFPDGRKVNSIARDRSALKHQIIRRFSHCNNPPIRVAIMLYFWSAFFYYPPILTLQPMRTA
jgi:hypothetical protein